MIRVQAIVQRKATLLAGDNFDMKKLIQYVSSGNIIHKKNAYTSNLT